MRLTKRYQLPFVRTPKVTGTFQGAKGNWYLSGGLVYVEGAYGLFVGDSAHCFGQ